MFSQTFMDGCDRLQSARNQEEITKAIQGFVENKGFWSFNLGYLDTLNFSTDEAPLKFISTMDEKWAEHYFNEGHDQVILRFESFVRKDHHQFWSDMRFRKKYENLPAGKKNI